MKTLKVKTPAKINLTLEVLNKREDGFHNIQSIMQTVNLYDFLTFNVSQSNKTEINLSGNSSEIPYDEHNLIYKCAKLAKEYSTAKTSTKAGVIYTKRKYLRKPPAAALGYVTYKNEKEIVVE